MDCANTWVVTMTEDSLNREIAFLEDMAETLENEFAVKTYLELEKLISAKKEIVASFHNQEKKRPMTNAERQRKFREKQKILKRSLEGQK